MFENGFQLICQVLRTGQNLGAQVAYKLLINISVVKKNGFDNLEPLHLHPFGGEWPV